MAQTDDFVAIDVETTGLYPEQGDRVVEVAAVRVANGEIVAEYSSLIACTRAIPRKIAKISGISNEMLVDQPSAESVFGCFDEFIGTSPLVAHNAEFEERFLRYEYSLLGATFSNRMWCSLKESRKRFRQLGRYRLRDVAEFLFGEVPKGVRMHRALGDARVVAEVWVWLGGRI